MFNQEFYPFGWKPQHFDLQLLPSAMQLLLPEISSPQVGRSLTGLHLLHSNSATQISHGNVQTICRKYQQKGIFYFKTFQKKKQKYFLTVFSKRKMKNSNVP